MIQIIIHYFLHLASLHMIDLIMLKDIHILASYYFKIYFFVFAPTEKSNSVWWATNCQTTG